MNLGKGLKMKNTIKRNQERRGYEKRKKKEPIKFSERRKGKRRENKDRRG